MKLMKIKTLISWFGIVAACLMLTLPVGAQQTQGYKNPVIPGFYPDPSVCRAGDDYYLVNSSFSFFPGVPLWHSKDMVHWEQIGNVLNRPSQLPFGSIFAPTIRYDNGTFYIITTNVMMMGGRGNFEGPKEGSGNFIVYTDDINSGNWSEPVWLELGGIDPSLYFEDGRCYMVSNGGVDGGIALAEINPKTGETLSDVKTLWHGTGGRSPEGPHLYKKDGYYYLMISEGGTEFAHMITIARSKRMEGPYDEVNPANPILTHLFRNGMSNPIQATGHADIVEATDGSWWMVCLAHRWASGNHHILGRETFVAPMRWDTNAWPVVNGNGLIYLDMDVPTLPQVPYAKAPVRTDFKNLRQLGLEWEYILPPVEANYQLSNQGLKLKAAKATLDAVNPTVASIRSNADAPTFVSRRQQHMNFKATTEVSLNGSRTGDEVGLTTFMSSEGHYEVALIRQADGKQAVTLRYRIGKLAHIEKVVPVTAKTVQLRVEGTPSTYTFSYATDGRNFTKLGEMDTKFISSETLGGFIGVMLGLYAQGNEGTRAEGTFSYFDYEGAE